MKNTRFGIVVFPGTWSDKDCYHAVTDILGNESVYIWHKETSLRDIDCLILPGGFSYGDYLRSGAIAKFSPIMDKIIGFANNGDSGLQSQQSLEPRAGSLEPRA